MNRTPSNPLAIQILQAIKAAGSEGLDDFRLDVMLTRHILARERDRALNSLKTLRLIYSERSERGSRRWFAIKPEATHEPSAEPTHGRLQRTYSCPRWPELSIGGRGGVRFHNGKFSTSDPKQMELVEGAFGYGDLITQDPLDLKSLKQTLVELGRVWS